MPRNIRRLSRRKKPVESGRAGEQPSERSVVTLIDYDDAVLTERRLDRIEECFACKHTATVTWINVCGTRDQESVQSLCQEFGVHPVALESIRENDRRPRYEDFGSYVFVSLKMFYLGKDRKEIVLEQVSFVLGNGFLLSFQETPQDVFEGIRERLRQHKGRIRAMDVAYLLYALIDAIVDQYFVILERVGEGIESIEDRIIRDVTPAMLREIHTVRQETVFLRRSVWPLREVIAGLERGDSALIPPPVRVFMRDLYDHTIQVIDTIETVRDVASNMLDIYLSSMSNRLNEVMRMLTVIATIFIPLTFVAGIYGMNFRYMPELQWPYGYPLVMGIMALIAVGMAAYFKVKKWF